MGNVPVCGASKFLGLRYLPGPPSPLPLLEHKKLQVRAWPLLPRTAAPRTRVTASPLSL